MVESRKTGASSARAFLSPAKINIFLKVLRRRPDGYHDISSLMVPVSLYDEIGISVGEGGGIEVSSSGRPVPAGSSNIAYRAAEAFLEASGLRKRVSISITKNIPVGAGLGGGSSDAATVLKGLDEISGAGLGTGRLTEIGARLGSDVPFFFLGTPALATGRGEVLQKVGFPSYYYVLINPGFEVSTAWVYGNLDLTKTYEDNILTVSVEALKGRGGHKGPIDRGGLEAVFKDPGKLLVNDLEPVTMGRHPEIGEAKRILKDRGADGSLMSGSGPTVFGLFKDPGKARSAFDSCKGILGPGYSVFLVRGL